MDWWLQGVQLTASASQIQYWRTIYLLLNIWKSLDNAIKMCQLCAIPSNIQHAALWLATKCLYLWPVCGYSFSQAPWYIFKNIKIIPCTWTSQHYTVDRLQTMHTGSASSVVWLLWQYSSESHTCGRPLLRRCPVPQSPQEEYLFTLCNPISPRLYLFPIDSWVMVHTWLTYASVYLSQNVLWEGV